MVLNVPNLNTSSGGNNNITMVKLKGGNARVRFDDTYILTAQNNGDGWTDFRGIIKVHAKIADGIGDVTQWTPSVPTGVNYQNVDEPTPNTTDYNDALTVGLIDVYQIEDITFNPIAIQVDLYMKKLDAGPNRVAQS